MTFWSAFWALTLGSAILEVVSIVIGIAGQREGLSTSVLARWAGFGRYGAMLLSLVIAISLIGWFGVQNALFAKGLASLVGGLPLAAWSLICGMAVTLIVIFGFLSMAWTAYVTVPAFLLLAGWSILSALQQHSLAALIASPPPGPVLTLGEGTTLVAGGFIVGAVITPDMTRFNRSAGRRRQADRGRHDDRRVPDRAYRRAARPRGGQFGRRADRHLDHEHRGHRGADRGHAEDQRLEPLLGRARHRKPGADGHGAARQPRCGDPDRRAARVGAVDARHPRTASWASSSSSAWRRRRSPAS